MSSAVSLQRTLGEHNDEAPRDERLLLCIGINVGDVIIDDEDVYGTGGNVAARLETLAEAGGICISGTTHDAIGHDFAAMFEFLGEQTMKDERDKPPPMSLAVHEKALPISRARSAGGNKSRPKLLCGKGDTNCEPVNAV